MDSFLPDIWDKVKDCQKFTDDEEMNKLMIEYVKNKSQEDFKNDLINLIKPFYEEFNLTEKDPQNITLEPFMIQNDLIKVE